MPRILYIWPPKVEYIFSLQKHFTDFGETLSYLAACPDVEIDVMDGSALLHFQWEFVQAYARDYDYLIVYTDLHNGMSAIRAMKQCKRISPKTVAVSFGHGTPYIVDTLLSAGFDAAIVDPLYHRAVVSYIRARDHGVDQSALRGIAVALTGGVVHPADPLPDQCDLPYPALDRLPIEQYKRVSGRNQLCFTVAKGCPFNCRFCRVPLVEGRRTAHRPVNDVVSYATTHAADYASVKFIAPTFTADFAWVLELCGEMRRQKAQFSWIVTTRLELLNEELLEAMSAAGCIAVAFGLETLYVETQLNVDKRMPKEVLRKQVALMHRHRIIPKAFVMLGIPGQTPREVSEMYMFLKAEGVEIRPKEYYPYERLLTATAEEKARLLHFFERDDVNKGEMPGVTTGEFVRLLSDRTAVR